MDFEWVAIALGDVVWIAMAFGLGFIARLMGLPALVGFLATGFVLNSQDIVSGETLGQLSDLGITLLLFTVGLKLNIGTLARPQVWAVTGLHTFIVVAVLASSIYLLAIAGFWLVADLNLQGALLIAFAMSFSSTVFVVKVLEERGAMKSLHGRIAIGILIMQDIAAVVFLAASSGKLPSWWALSIVLVIPLRPLLHLLLQRVGHGELLVLYGFLLALGGAEIFELVGLKGDLGALVAGVAIASHAKAEELVKTMLGFKDLFLLGFFLSIGMSGQLTLETFAIAALLTPLVFFKSVLFFGLLTRFKLRARTALHATLNLSNFSEFGLIVVAVSVANGWLANQWLVVLAIALSFSFVISAWLNTVSHQLYIRHGSALRSLQTSERLPEDRLHDLGGATIAIVGMGGFGTGAYDKMHELHGDTVVGIDSDPVTVRNQQTEGRRVLLGDPSDPDFWDRLQAGHTLQLVMLALPKHLAHLAVIGELKAAAYSGKIAATAKFPDEVTELEEAGVSTVFSIYSEAGAGFAAHVSS